MSSNQKAHVDEDDELDELDDVLNQFSSPAPPQPTSAVASVSPQRHASDAPTDDFAAALAEEMASLLKGLENEPLDPGGTQTDFQSSIRSTMNKLKASETGLKSSDPSASDDSKTIEALLSQFGDLGDLSGPGAENEDQFQGVLEAMMGQLMGRDVLYEPLKELHEKFPGYLVEHSSTISAEDRNRFEAQITCIKRLLDTFEAESYNDDDENARRRIVELMDELQTHGSPPGEIMGPLPPGFTMGEDGLPNMPEGCNQM